MKDKELQRMLNEIIHSDFTDEEIEESYRNGKKMTLNEIIKARGKSSLKESNVQSFDREKWLKDNNLHDADSMREIFYKK